MVVLYNCIVCGKKFPEGQGVVIRREGIELYFHSKDCLGRFAKRLLLDAPDISCLLDEIRELVKQFEKLRSKEKTI